MKIKPLPTGTLIASVDKVSHDVEQNKQTEHVPQEVAKESIGAGTLWVGAARAGFTAEVTHVHNFNYNSAIRKALKIQSFSQHTWWQTWPNLCLFGSIAFAWPKLEKVSLINLNILTFHHRNTNVSNYGFAVP